MFVAAVCSCQDRNTTEPIPFVNNGERGRGWWDEWGLCVASRWHLHSETRGLNNSFRELGMFFPPVGAVAFSFQGVVGGPSEGRL